MKNQMMNLFASYSFYYFPGYYYCADCFCCKKQPSPTEMVFRSFGNVKENAEPVVAVQQTPAFLFPGYHQTYA